MTINGGCNRVEAHFTEQVPDFSTGMVRQAIRGAPVVFDERPYYLEDSNGMRWRAAVKGVKAVGGGVKVTLLLGGGEA